MKFERISAEELKANPPQISESNEQIKLFRWVFDMQNYFPEVGLLFHIPNGGLRNKRVAAKLKQEGVRAGVPDLFLPVAKQGYFGLFIEMKIKGGRTTQKQDDWLANLKAQGYSIKVCYSTDEAQETISRYLGLKI